jgi:hypothetical protein
MGRHLRVVLVLLAVVVGSSACATSGQWAQWRQHATHFASGDHLVFSLRNQGERPTPRVTRHDLKEAKAQAWW